MSGDAGIDRMIVAGFCAFLGLFVGSFLNVVIYRVPAGESVVKPRSRCPKCGTQITSVDNIPVLSWLILRGKCRSCGVHISARYPLIELGTAGLFGCVGFWLGPAWDLPAFLYLAAIGIALTMIDLDTRRLPNAIVLPSYGVALALLGVAGVADDRLFDLGRACAGGVIAFGVYFLLALIYPAGMGFGDVKLAGVLGIYLGWVGWPSLAVGIFAAFLIGAVIGLALMAAGRGGRKTAVPFGPFMVVGTFVGLWAGPAIVGLYFSVLGLS
ncbi:MAG: prepilin peptidase [Actinomycetes bacterium]|jgi:leader peptidase (prepilin peptidase)/N-methyltransferase